MGSVAQCLREIRGSIPAEKKGYEAESVSHALSSNSLPTCFIKELITN